MAGNNRPPVIPEIAKAYQNDPRTQLAMAQMQGGMSGAPVAQGKYAMADGIARMLQGVLGGYMAKKSMGRYSKDEEALMALRQARGQDVMADTATQMAGQFGAPPAPQGAPQGAPQAMPQQMPPNPPAAPPMGLPAPAQGQQGGPPMMPPFSGTGGTPDIAVTGAPMRPERLPTRPSALGPTRSRTLRMAGRVLADANPYESAGGMDMLNRGMEEQGRFDEAATGREQQLVDSEYGAALSRYGQDKSMRTGDMLERGRMETQHEYNNEDREDAQKHQLSLTDIEYKHQMQRAGFDRNTSVMLAQLNNSADMQRTRMQIEAARGTQDEKNAAKRTMFFSTPTGAKLYDAASQRVEKNAQAKAQLAQFLKLNYQRGTGGPIMGNVPGLVKWSSSALTDMEAITQNLSIDLSGALKGAISDKEGDRLLASLPSIKHLGKANQQIIRRLDRALDRASDFETRRLEAIAQGDQVPFMTEWNAYRDAISIDKDTTFDQWKANIPKVGVDGKRKK
jgi:hypothetical protein